MIAFTTPSGPSATTPTWSSRTSYPWQYGQKCTWSPHSSATPGTSGSSSRTPAVTSRCPASSTAPDSSLTVKPPVADTTRSLISSTPYLVTSSRPSRNSSPGGSPSLVRNPCDSCAAALRGSPESTTATLRRARPSTSAADSPAGPPPMITTSYMSDHLRDPGCELVPALTTFVADTGNMTDAVTTALAEVGP